MAEFLAMGGYGAFVWPAYGLTALIMVGFLVSSWQGLRGRRRDLERLEATLPSRRGRGRKDSPGGQEG